MMVDIDRVSERLKNNIGRYVHLKGDNNTVFKITKLSYMHMERNFHPFDEENVFYELIPYYVVVDIRDQSIEICANIHNVVYLKEETGNEDR